MIPKIRNNIHLMIIKQVLLSYRDRRSGGGGATGTGFDERPQSFNERRVERYDRRDGRPVDGHRVPPRHESRSGPPVRSTNRSPRDQPVRDERPQQRPDRYENR